MKRTLLILLLAVCGQFAFAQTLSFVDKANMPTARGGSSSAFSEGFEYISNGFSAATPHTTQIEKYDFVNNSWSTFTTSIPTIGKRYGNSEFVNGVLYLYNGITATGPNNKLEIIEPGTGNVTVSATLNPSPVYGAGSSVFGDYLLSFGGAVSEWEGIYSNKFYKISPDGQWTALADMPVAVQTEGAVVYGNGSNAKLYAFGGYSQSTPLHENFETVATTGNLALTDWINTMETGAGVFFQGKSFGGNKYAQVTAFNPIVAEQNAFCQSWLISPTINLLPGSYLTFDTKDGYDNGATLEAYLITNWTGDIMTSGKSLLPADISSGHTSGYAADFTSSGIIGLNGAIGDNRIAFKYTGGYSPLATTTFQIDNVRIYQENKTNDVYEYDFNTDSWTTNAGVLPVAVSAHSIAVDDPFTAAKIYVTGDYNNQTFLGYYDTANGDFTTLNQTAMVGRRHHSAEVFDNKLYLFGGNTTPQSSSTLNSTQSSNLSVLTTAEFGKAATVSFYPNPANDKIYFNSAIESVSLFTFEGKKIDAVLQDNRLDLSGLSKGIYLIQGTEKGGSSFSEKLIKN